MRRIDRYIFRLILPPFLFFVLVFTGVIWLAQSLRVIDTIVNAGQSAGVFLAFAALLLPEVLSVVLPISAFAATLYAVNRLYTDSEVVVMFASGVSGLALLRPVLVFASGITLVCWLLTLWAIPTAQRESRDRLTEIRGDVAAAFLREGTFMSPTSGVTIYIRAIGRPGELTGVFVHDQREPERTVTYTSERAILLPADRSRRKGEADAGTRLVMLDGIAQIAGPGRATALQVLRFERFAYDLGAFEREGEARLRKPSELYLPRLLGIDAAGAEAAGRRLGKYRAEAHEALSAPLYALALPLLGAAFVVAMGFRRQGFAGRILAAVAAAVLLRLAGVAAKGMIDAAPAAAPLIYLPPLAAVAAAVWMLIGAGRGGIRPSRAAGAAA
ncbi:MAG TPA: LPS export ABC transporter permease LptF [Thermohalobaculum sp.]|nr:LPS export ABC transporter permease LptF [Thermohalobaculum sp.]